MIAIWWIFLSTYHKFYHQHVSCCAPIHLYLAVFSLSLSLSLSLSRARALSFSHIVYISRTLSSKYHELSHLDITKCRGWRVWACWLTLPSFTNSSSKYLELPHLNITNCRGGHSSALAECGRVGLHYHRTRTLQVNITNSEYHELYPLSITNSVI